MQKNGQEGSYGLAIVKNPKTGYLQHTPLVQLYKDTETAKAAHISLFMNA